MTRIGEQRSIQTPRDERERKLTWKPECLRSDMTRATSRWNDVVGGSEVKTVQAGAGQERERLSFM